MLPKETGRAPVTTPIQRLQLQHALRAVDNRDGTSARHKPVRCSYQKAPKQARVTAYAGPLCPQANPPTPPWQLLCTMRAGRHLTNAWPSPSQAGYMAAGVQAAAVQYYTATLPQYTTVTSHWPILMCFMASVTEHPAHHCAADLVLPLVFIPRTTA